MAKLVSKKDHELRSGFLLEFDNGHLYSVVDLSSPIKEEEQAENTSLRQALEGTGKMYDMMGGRFEAILLPESNNGKWGDPIRVRSFDDVIEHVESQEGIE